MNHKLLGSLSILAATIVYAGFGILARIVGFSIPLFYQNATRNLFAAILLGTIILLQNKKGSWEKMTPYAWSIVCMRALMGSASFLLFFYTMNNMAIGMAYFLYYATNTIGGYFLGRLFFQEKITPIKWLAFILALTGLSFIYALNLTHVAPLLVFSAILAGALCSGWFIIIKKVKEYPSSQLTFLDLVIPFFLYTILSIIFHEPWTMPQMTQPWIASFFYGACFIITGQLIVFGFKKVEAQIGSLIMLAEIPIATLLAYIIYNEHITVSTSIGGILILVAMTLPELAALKKRKN